MAKTIVDILVSKNILPLNEGVSLRKEAKDRHVTVEDLLYAHGISERDVAEAKSELSGYPVKFLEETQIPFEALRDIPEESARYYRMIPLSKEEGTFDVGLLNPDDVAAQEALKFISGRVNLPARVFVITPSDFQRMLEAYKTLSGEVTGALGIFQKEQETQGFAKPSHTEEGLKTQLNLAEEAPVTKIVSVILRHAAEGRASDIHIEPQRDKVRVRFRVDGLLHTSLTLPLDVHLALISRIKVMTNLKIDETRIPQDGRFHADVLGRGIDFRVSTLPTAFGEKVVIRILDPSGGIQTLEDLGLDGRNLAVIQQTITRPYGMILITGPTGSGKSTTLYAIMQLLNNESINIISLEDPIEYYIAGVNQSQVRPEINYDFAAGIRHVVRQDPDIIMVGEIRDKETAALAIHAALTGHLVLSTLHTNNAVGVIPRLIDMGVDPFLLSPTLILAVGQRLTRKLCPESKAILPMGGRAKDVILDEMEKMPDEVRALAKKDMPNHLYKAEMSPVCPKGTRGRTGIFEVLTMTPELEKIILTSPSEANIEAEAKRQGMITMRQDGIIKVLKGIIGIEELLEVV